MYKMNIHFNLITILFLINNILKTNSVFNKISYSSTLKTQNFTLYFIRFTETFYFILSM